MLPGHMEDGLATNRATCKKIGLTCRPALRVHTRRKAAQQLEKPSRRLACSPKPLPPWTAQLMMTLVIILAIVASHTERLFQFQRSNFSLYCVHCTRRSSPVPRDVACEVRSQSDVDDYRTSGLGYEHLSIQQTDATPVPKPENGTIGHSMI